MTWPLPGSIAERTASPAAVSASVAMTPPCRVAAQVARGARARRSARSTSPSPDVDHPHAHPRVERPRTPSRSRISCDLGRHSSGIPAPPRMRRSPTRVERSRRAVRRLTVGGTPEDNPRVSATADEERPARHGGSDTEGEAACRSGSARSLCPSWRSLWWLRPAAATSRRTDVQAVPGATKNAHRRSASGSRSTSVAWVTSRSTMRPRPAWIRRSPTDRCARRTRTSLRPTTPAPTATPTSKRSPKRATTW